MNLLEQVLAVVATMYFIAAVVAAGMWSYKMGAADWLRTTIK